MPKSPTNKTRLSTKRTMPRPCLRRREKYEEAIFYFREALRLDADFIEAYSNSAMHKARGRF